MKYLVDIISNCDNDTWHIKLNDDQIRLIKFLCQEDIINFDDFGVDIKDNQTEYKEI